PPGCGVCFPSGYVKEIAHRRVCIGMNFIVVRPDANKYAGFAAAYLVQSLSRILKRFPCEFQQQPLLRIHPFRFTRRNLKKGSVKFIDVPQKSAAPGGWSIVVSSF